MTDRDDTAAPAESPVINQLLARVEELERRLANSQASTHTAQVSTPTAPAALEAAEARTGRRNFLRLAGVAATGLAASAVISDRAAAADNGTVLQGSGQNANNTSATTTTLTNSGTAGLTVAALKGVAPSNSNGIWGVSNGSIGAGVFGDSDAGYGVYGTSGTGYDFYSGGNGRVGLTQHLTSGSPTGGTYAVGDIFRNGAGDLYVCVTGGAAPATAVFRKLAGPASAGATHLLSTPVRIFDSRPAEIPNNGTGPIANGQEVVIDVPSQAPQVPTGATAAIVSVLAFNTLSDGFISAYEEGTTYPGTINVFWSAGMQVASTTFVRLSSLRKFRLHCQCTTGLPTNVAIDLIGYLR